jgi:PTH2 family peptidyl-tRNA hydrolase
MSPGKAAAQAGHAFLDTYLAALAVDPARAAAYLSDPFKAADPVCRPDSGCPADLADPATTIRPYSGTKVVLLARDLDALQRAAYEAKAAGLPWALITDSGHVLPATFDGQAWRQPFDGSPVVTALGLGPARRAEVRHITDRLALVR